MAIRVLVAAGGTGGHLFPGLAAAKVLRSRGHFVHFAVRADADTQAALAREGFPSSAFWFEGFPRGLSPRLLSYPLRAATAWLSAKRILRREAPDVVLGMGGYISVPVALAAGAPLVVHEQNARAGLANRLLSRRARAVATSFDPTDRLAPRCRTVRTGLPLRADLEPRPGADSRRSLGLDPEARTLLIFGGSQGARSLNALALGALSRLPGSAWQVIHLTGPADEAVARVAHARAGRNAFVRAFWPDMASAYSAADFVLARCGANTVMELKRMGPAALLVPYPHATDDHQAANARWLEREGQARWAREKDLTESALAALLEAVPDPARLRAEAEERRRRVPEDFSRAAPRLADLVEEVAKEGCR